MESLIGVPMNTKSSRRIASTSDVELVLDIGNQKETVDDLPQKYRLKKRVQDPVMNQVEESGDNIKVLVRIRPMDKELKRCVELKGSEMRVGLNGGKKFNFDKVLQEDCDQMEVFRTAGVPVVNALLEGYHGSIFAYGQTNSGKTYTMQGENGDLTLGKESGLIPRIFEHLFERMEKQKDEIDYECACTYLEIYNEKIYDLLKGDGEPKGLRQDLQNGIYVQGLYEATIGNEQDAMEQLRVGGKNRTVGITNMNHESSRSHSVFTIKLQQCHIDEDGIEVIRHSQLNLVDLAGSERQVHTGAAGVRMKEASQINKSLSALGNVIKALDEVASGAKRHIPYRDSKLTFLLRDCLGGNSKTTILATISSNVKWMTETLSTLKFAQRAKHIKNNATVNEAANDIIANLKAEIVQLKAQMQNDQPQHHSANNTEQILQHISQLLAGKSNPPPINNLSQPIEKAMHHISDQALLLKSQIQTATSTIKEYRAAGRKQKQLIATSKSEQEILKHQLSELQNQPASPSVSKTISENNATIANLRLQLASSKDKLEQHHIAFGAIEYEKLQLQQALLDHKHDTDPKLRQLDIRNSNLAEKLNEQNLAFDTLTKTHEQLERKLQQESQTVKDLQTAASLKESQLNHLNSQNNILETNAHELRVQLQAKSNQLERSEREKDELRRQLHDTIVFN